MQNSLAVVVRAPTHLPTGGFLDDSSGQSVKPWPEEVHGPRSPAAAAEELLTFILLGTWVVWKLAGIAVWPLAILGIWEIGRQIYLHYIIKRDIMVSCNAKFVVRKQQNTNIVRYAWKSKK